MKVEQINEILNSLRGMKLGEKTIEDINCDNVVSYSQDINEMMTPQLENFTHTLIDRIGKTRFLDRIYTGTMPSLYMDGWEYGSIEQKIEALIPENEENVSWQLVRGRTYDMTRFTPPEVVQRFFNNQTTYDVRMSFAEKQVKSAFVSAEQVNSFFSMIENAIRNGLTLNNEALASTVVSSMAAQTYLSDHRDHLIDISNHSGIKAVNLLKLYKDKHSTDTAIQSMTPSQAAEDPEFIRFAVMVIRNYQKRLAKATRLFNIGGMVRFTDSSNLNMIMYDPFKNAADVYLQSDTFHDEYTKLPNADTVPYWQGSGLDYDFESASSIDVTVPDLGNSKQETNVHISGLLAVLYDRECMGINNYNHRVRAFNVDLAEFINYSYKTDARYFNDENENFIMFFVA